MSDPKRLSEGGGDEHQRALLASASDDRPSPAARRAAMVALGISAGAIGTSLPGWHRLVRWKWVGIAGVAGALTVAALSHRSTPPAVADAPEVRPPPPAAVEKPRASPPEQLEPQIAPAPPVRRQRQRIRTIAADHERDSSSPTRSFEEELALVETAREAQRDHRPHDALRLIERHAREFPDGALQPEAELLHVEALLQLDDRTRAASVARDFIARYPDSPLVEKARALLKRATAE